MVSRVHFRHDRQHPPVGLKHVGGPRGAGELPAVHRFLHQRVSRLRKTIPRVTHQHEREFFLFSLARLGDRTVAAHRDETETGPFQLVSESAQAFDLTIAARRAALHIDGHHGSPAEKFSKGHFPRTLRLTPRMNREGKVSLGTYFDHAGK